MENHAFYAASADAIVAIHTLFVGFVVIGQLLILIGLVCRWKWVRNPWFRVIHLLCIGIVAMEAASGIICPLTVWERELRDLAGQTVNDSAVGWFFNSILFFNMPREFFVWIHISFGALVLGTFILGPPRFRQQTPKPPRPKPSNRPQVPSADNRKARLQPSCDQGSLVG